MSRLPCASSLTNIFESKLLIEGKLLINGIKDCMPKLNSKCYINCIQIIWNKKSGVNMHICITW